MKDQLISYETAVLAKEKGFNIPVLYSYGLEGENTLSPTDDNSLFDLNTNGEHGYSAPTQSLLQKWLRDIKDMWVLLDFDGITYDISIYGRYTPTDEIILINNTGSENFEDKYFLRYEHALEVGLFEALKLIEK